MSSYGLTPEGVNIKRLDTILNELHTNLSKEWGVNTQRNQESLLNHMLTNFADKIAELWELGEAVYYANYPSSAEDLSLDRACQYAGVERKSAAKTIYPIHCTGIDGTVLDTGTAISSDTNPRADFSASASSTIERSSFNRARLRVVSEPQNETYTVSINGTLYSYTSGASGTETDVLNGLAQRIEAGGDFDATVMPATAELPVTLDIVAKDVTRSYVMLLTENLTTETVTSIINFASDEYGEVIVPNGAICVIRKGPSGFTACENLCSYVSGRLRESDTELRQSYADKIFHLSDRTLQAIRAAILTNCQGVNSVAIYENDQDEVDAAGRYPHSIEVIVDGGNPTEIAEQIRLRKAGGINTYGSTETELTGENGETITIRFSRPSYVYVWWHIGITQDSASQLPSDYATQIKKIIATAMKDVTTGDDIIPQRVFERIYEAVDGIAYIDAKLYTTTNSADAPEVEASYTRRSLTVAENELAITTDAMVEVALDG